MVADDSLKMEMPDACFLAGEDSEDLSALLNSLLHNGSVDEHGTPVLKRSRSCLSAVCSPVAQEASAQLQETAGYLRAEIE